MTSPDDLLRAILADPANDDLRLVFADLLDDRGEGERSEFIRHQIAIAQQYPDCMKCERTREPVGWFAKFTPRCRCRPCTMARREYMLCRRHLHVEWDCGEPWSSWPKVWARGFVAEVHTDTSSWLAHGPALVRRQPIERVVLTGCTPLCHTGLLRRVYAWAGGQNGPTTPYHLPNELFSFIDWDSAEPSDHSHGYTGWSTESAALDALSAAAIMHARSVKDNLSRC